MRDETVQFFIPGSHVAQPSVARYPSFGALRHRNVRAPINVYGPRSAIARRLASDFAVGMLLLPI
jgi:hypothetical protein